MVCTILQHKLRTSNLISTWTLHNHAGWAFHGSVQVLPEAAQRPMQFQQVKMQGLGIVTKESNVMPGPQSIHKVSPGLAKGISTNTKVNQQPPLVCLP